MLIRKRTVVNISCLRYLFRKLSSDVGDTADKKFFNNKSLSLFTSGCLLHFRKRLYKTESQSFLMKMTQRKV